MEMTRLKTILNKYKKSTIKKLADMVNNPPHYTRGGIEAIEYMEAKATPEEFAGHLRLTALKYLSRTGYKDDALQDLKKAQWYVNRLVSYSEKQTVLGRWFK
jgi:hypothetical protein